MFQYICDAMIEMVLTWWNGAFIYNQLCSTTDSRKRKVLKDTIFIYVFFNTCNMYILLVIHKVTV